MVAVSLIVQLVLLDGSSSSTTSRTPTHRPQNAGARLRDIRGTHGFIRGKLYYLKVRVPRFKEGFRGVALSSRRGLEIEPRPMRLLGGRAVVLKIDVEHTPSGETRSSTPCGPGPRVPLAAGAVGIPLPG